MNEEFTGDPGDHVLRRALADDYASLRYFRQTLFVRAGQAIDRRIDPDRLAGMYLSTRLRRGDDGSFTQGEDRIEIGLEDAAAALELAAAQWPRRVPLADVAARPEQLRLILQLFAEWYVNLHISPAPFTLQPGPYPETSPLIRGMIAMGEASVCTLDHGLLRIDQGELRALLLAADGTRSMAEVAAAGHGIPPGEVPDALAASAARALIRR